MIALGIVLVLAMAIGCWRIIHGPTRSDRLLPVQLFGSTTIALILLLAHVREEARLLDVALVLAALALVLPAALAEHLRKSNRE